MAKKKSQLPNWLPDAGLFALRLSVAFIFIYAGAMKLGDLEMVSGMLENLGFPASTFFAYVLALVELLGGIAILVGFLTSWAAGLLAITMIVALVTAHAGGPLNEAFTAIALLGSSLALMATGAGKWRVFDDCLCHDRQK